MAQLFPDPVPLNLSAAEKEEILSHLTDLYNGQVEDREKWRTTHEGYDAMFRGDVGPRQGPWEGSADLHIPASYWLVDSICVRLDSTVWGQTPLVGGQAEEDDDQDAFRHASNLIDWHLQPKRMNARMIWSRCSRLRGIHGFSVALLSYVKDMHVHRKLNQSGPPAFMVNPNQTFQLDEEGKPVEAVPQDIEWAETIKYHGPVIEPQDWDDVVTGETTGINLQPRSPSNPNGAPWVFLRSWEDLNLIWKKKESTYTYIEGEQDDKDWWKQQQPAQDRSINESGTSNQSASQLHDRFEGRERNARGVHRRGTAGNPEFETICAFHPWLVEGPDGEDVDQECVFFFSRRPRVLLGAYRLSDIVWTGERPLLEWHYQPVGVRWYSLGVMEIAQHLSAELDTIHNMRMDVGFATNMPFFFFVSTSGINPENIELKPLKGVPVDNINDVAFPQLQNVTSFFYQEEQLLYTLIERVMGVTDLFLGISPTQGAAARHATGFVGTQQEALARTQNVVSQDAETFSRLCRLVYNMELQYGPEHRILRLQGEEGPLTRRLTRDELRMRGEYDFRLGSNQGTYSSMLRQQQGQLLMELAQWNPLMAQDLGRLWEATRFHIEAGDISQPERFIGPKSAIGPGVAKDQAEENGEMDQQVYGVDLPAPVHPNDNDQQHITESIAHLGSDAYISMGQPNQAGHLAHIQLHTQAQQQKQTMQAQQQAQAMQQGATGQPPAAAAPTPGGQDRIVPQLTNVDQAGQMGQLPTNGQPPSGSPSPQIGPV